MSTHFERAGRWFLVSGIQQPAGGVARYYRADTEQNRPVSTEITGYAIGALAYLHTLTGERRYLDRALDAARFLVRDAWRADLCAMPFETDPPALCYFFDCGIIVRGLLAAWRAAPTEEFLDCAVAVGRAMIRDFRAADGWHPALTLPAKTPASRDSASWSRMPGCYQLKSAMAWWDLYQATGETAFREPYQASLDLALANSAGFLPDPAGRLKTMDRLHAYLYFLEGLMPVAEDPRCAQALAGGIRQVACLLHDIEPEFARADVYAQLLRIRILADAAGAEPLDQETAAAEAHALGEFQAVSTDPRIDGGFWFGRRDGTYLPHVNPVSAAFAIEALDLWERRAAALAAGRPLI
ncbi:MAG: hypothetical protein WBL61_07025 [Bryobacteraceae bacterium]